MITFSTPYSVIKLVLKPFDPHKTGLYTVDFFLVILMLMLAFMSSLWFVFYSFAGLGNDQFRRSKAAEIFLPVRSTVSQNCRLRRYPRTVAT